MRSPSIPCPSASSAWPSRRQNCPRCRAPSAPKPRSQARLRQRLNAGLRQIAFFIVPSAMAFFALGDVDRRRAVPVRQVHPRERGLRLGNHCGLGRRTPRLHARPPLRFHLLCATRYADAAALRVAARRAHRRSGIPVRPPAAPLARHRSALGRGGPDRVRGSGGLGGIHAAAAHAERPHRRHRSSRFPHRQAVGLPRPSALRPRGASNSRLEIRRIRSSPRSWF